MTLPKANTGKLVTDLTYETPTREVAHLREQTAAFGYAMPLSGDAPARGNWEYWRRLRRKFLREGLEALTDLEALEILLSFSGPKSRRHATLAAELLERFGTLAGVMGAEFRHLSEFSAESRRATYMAIALLKASHVAAVKLAHVDVVDRPVLSSFDAVIKYCQARMAFSMEEELRILFLNRKNMLIMEEKQQRGSVDHVPLYPRKVAKRALDVGASSIVMAHNHPSGDPTPSSSDISMTRQVVDALKLFEITVHDHIIIGVGSHFSMRSAGYMS